MTVDFSGFRNFFTLNFIKKPIYNAFAMAAGLKENVLECEGGDEKLSVFPTRDDAGNYAILLSYASPHFDEDIPDLEAVLEIAGVKGKKHVTLWAVDKDHTNPCGLFMKNAYAPALTKEQITILRREGCLKPLREYDCQAEGVLSIPVEIRGHGILLAEF